MSENYVSGNKLSRLATNAVIGIGGGIALLIVAFLLKKILWPVGLAIGVVVAALGIAGLLSKSKTDKKGSFIALAIGLVLLFAFKGIGPVKVIAGVVLSIGAFTAIGFGIRNGLLFLLGLYRWHRTAGRGGGPYEDDGAL